MKTNRNQDIACATAETLFFLGGHALEDFSFVLAVREALKGKDALSPEEKITDQVNKEVGEKTQDLVFLLSEMKADDPLLSKLCQDSAIIPIPLETGLKRILQIRERKDVLAKEKKKGTLPEFKLPGLLASFETDLIHIFRIRAWLNDIALGMQEYGIAPYDITGIADATDFLTIIDSFTPQRREAELQKALTENALDSRQDSHDKKELKAFLKAIQSSK